METRSARWIDAAVPEDAVAGLARDAQRIRGLSLWKAVWHAVKPDRSVKTLIEEFDYPRLGPGQMWERFTARLEERGSRVLLGRSVARIAWHRLVLPDLQNLHSRHSAV